MRSNIGTDNSKRTKDIGLTLMSVVILLFLGWLLCQPYVKNGLFDDDKGLVESIRTNSVWTMINSTGAYKYRPVTFAFIEAMWRIAGNDVYTLLHLLPIVNGMLGVCLFVASYRTYQNRMIAFGLAMAFLSSRFAYYHVTNLYGLMEMIALFFAFLVLIFSLDYFIKGNQKSIWIALVSYLLVIYAHERYLVLVGFLILSILLARLDGEDKKTKIREKLAYTLCAIAICAFSLVVRSVMFGANAWQGTGGTDMVSGFSFETILKHVWIQIKYLFGWGDSETYLSGLSSAQVSWEVTLITIMFDTCVLGLFALFFISWAGRKTKEAQTLIALGLVFVFIGSCILSSSTTIRVEMRWIYVSQVAMLWGIAFLTTFCLKDQHIWLRILAGVLCACALMSSSFVEMKYREGWRNLFFYPEISADDSLVENTIYSESSVGKKRLYIIDPDRMLNKEYIERVFNIWAPESGKRPKKIKILNNLAEVFQEEKQGMIISYENGKYYTIPQNMTRRETVQTVSGAWYSDGWASKELSIDYWPYYTETFRATFFTNVSSVVEQFTDEERTVRIYLNSELIEEFVMTEQPVIKELRMIRGAVNHLDIRTQFVSAGRDGNELSYTLFIDPVE